MRDDEIRPYIVKAIMFLAKHTTASTLLARADSVLPFVLEAISSDDIESYSELEHMLNYSRRKLELDEGTR